MSMKLSCYHVITQPFFDQIEERVKRVVFATRTANVRIIDDYTWTILAAGQLDELPQDVLLDLAEIELIVPTGENELQTILSDNHAVATNDDNLYLVVQPLLLSHSQ